MGQGFRATVRSMPMETNAVVSMTPKIHFGKAPPHAQYPLGGLRVSLTMKSYPLATNAADVGLVAATLSANNYGVNLCATAAYVFGTAVGVEYPSIFDNLSGAIPMATFGQYFRQYIVDEADIHFVSEVGPIDGTYAPLNILMSREHDIYSAARKATSLTANDAFVGEDCITFPAWTPLATYSIVPKSSTSKSFDRELFYTTAVRDNIDLSTADDAATARQTVQGACYIVGSAPLAAKTVGQLWVTATIDFYGFNQGGTGAVPVRPVRKERRHAIAGASPESKSFKDDYLVVDSDPAVEQTPRAARPSQLPLSEPAVLRRTADLRHSADGLGGLPSSTRKA